MNILGLSIGIPVKNLEESAKWYRKLLGEREEFNPVEGITEFLLTKGSWLQLMEVPDFLPSENNLRFEVEDIDAVLSHLEILEVSPAEIVRIPELLSFIEFKDIDGNSLSFYQLDPQGM